MSEQPKIGCVNHDCDKCKAVQEPIYQMQMMDGKWIDQAKQSYEYNKAHGNTVRIVYTTPPAQPAPVAWPCVIAEADFEQNTITLEMKCSDYKVGAGQHWLHTTPPIVAAPLAAQKPWVGLTDEERNKIRFDYLDYDERARAIEAKLKEKNT